MDENISTHNVMENPIFDGLVKEEIEDIMYMREGFSCRCSVDRMLTDSLYNLVKANYLTDTDYRRHDVVLNDEMRQNHLEMLRKYRAQTQECNY